MANTNKFLILDGHSLAYRAFHGLPVENFATSSGQHTNAVYGFTSMLSNVLKEQKPTHLAVAFDVSRDTFRSKRYPDYKATRAKSPPEFKGQVELIKEILNALQIQVITADGFEADDILATLAHHCDFEVKIISGDRDTFQLVDQRVTVLYPRKGMSDLVLMTPDAIKEKYGVLPTQYRDLAAMVGEASDNLPGVPGVGPKTAAKWIEQYGSLENIIANAKDIGGKVGESMRASLERVQENYELNRLVIDAPVEIDINAYAKRDYDPAKVHEVLDAIEFSALRPRVFAAWPSSGSNVAPAPKETKSKTTKADPVKIEKTSEVNVDLAELAITTTKVSGEQLTKWLNAHQKEKVALAFAGVWAQGRGTIDAVAFVNAKSESIWCDFQPNKSELKLWLESPAAKYIHDSKGPALALLSQDIELAGINLDTALAAYLLAPGSRNLTLSDLSQRYLRKNLVELDSNAAQLSFDNASDVSGDKLAIHAQATFELANYFEKELQERGGQNLLSEMEIPLVQVLVKMESAGIAIDTVALKKLEDSFEADAVAATKQAHKAAGHEFNLGSPKQLQEVLFEERGLPKTKKIKTGYTTDAEALQGLLAKLPDDELLVALLRYREVSKLRQTVTGLLSCVADDGRIHTTFNQMIAATGRLSSTEPNLQNIPIRTDEGVRIRDTFVVGKGYETLLTADYSQIELRVMAHLSNDQGLIDALNSGEDLHTTVGSYVFGVDKKDVDAEMRRKIKAMSYGLAYGLSAFGLANQLGISNGEAKSLMDTYFERFGGVRDYLANVVKEARKLGYTESIMGRRRYLPDLNSDNRQLRDMAERMALNAPIQGSAADLVKVAMLKVEVALKAAGVKSRLLLQVHDELIIEVATGELEQVKQLVTKEMGSVGKMGDLGQLSVPMEVSLGIGKSWSQAAH